MLSISENDKKEILGKEPTKSLYYKFGDYTYKRTAKERILSSVRELDYLTKGFELGCITLWTGLTNSGKTSVLTMITKQTIQQGERVFFFNGEQTKDDFKNNLYKQSVKKEDIEMVQYKDSCIFDYFVKESKIPALDKLYGENLFIYNNEMARDINTLLYAMEECRRNYGVRAFILDNFMQIDVGGDNIFQEQTEIMEKLRTFAVNKNVHIHLVSHPRKIERLQLRLTLYDIAGSMNLANKAYNIVSIMRVDTIDKESNEYKKLKKEMLDAYYDIDKTSTVLEILKTKGTACGLVGLIYDPTTKTFTQQDKLLSSEREKKVQQMGKKEDCPF